MDVVDILLENYANEKIRNYDGKTPWEMDIT